MSITWIKYPFDAERSSFHEQYDLYEELGQLGDAITPVDDVFVLQRKNIFTVILLLTLASFSDFISTWGILISTPLLNP